MKNLFPKLSVGVCLSLAFLPAGADEPARSEPAGISQITVQRTWCYGTCPIDSLTLNADGSASYSGFRVKERHGLSSGTISKDRFTAIAKFLQEQNFFELKPQIGQGNADTADLLVSATRGGLPYCVALRLGGNRELQQKMETALLVADEIGWTRDEEASDSGVEGILTRQLTAHEAHLFQDRPEIKNLRMPFALVELKSLEHPDVKRETRSDKEGRFQIFAPPGRYCVTARNLNDAVEFRVENPYYDYPSQNVEVQAKAFVKSDLFFKDINVGDG